MPATLSEAVNFLETQWSSINQNKIKGILAEVRLKRFLTTNNTYFGPGGWIVIPGKPTYEAVPPRLKVCLLPRTSSFSWQSSGGAGNPLSPAEISAYSYFRQLGIQTYFADPFAPNESAFALPAPSAGSKRAFHPKPYHLELKQVGNNGQLESVAPSSVFSKFPERQGNRGLKCYKLGRISLATPPWNDPLTVSELFWFEYARYYFNLDRYMSNNDLDMYVIGPSGSAYPVELKSKEAAVSPALGEWFGIDMGPFAKLAFFTANAMNTDALYVVEEVASGGQFVDWLGIRYTDLVKACSWVGQGGGTGMTGATSSTYKVPKAAFSSLAKLLPTL
ncbi:hypothetical protein ABIE51_002467 [Lysobacter sp. OAE881]|uniref:hypothetical protein n=1 Tax=Lysobacter sp. OAE881 TaxID=2663813 RepID=UPI00178A5D42